VERHPLGLATHQERIRKEQVFNFAEFSSIVHESIGLISYKCATLFAMHLISIKDTVALSSSFTNSYFDTSSSSSGKTFFSCKITPDEDFSFPSPAFREQ